jgi:hypothetical protein
MKSVLHALSSESFLEKALLLIAGAILTGILVPVVKAWMDRAAFERQKTFEAHLARQSDIIKAQTQFLTEFSNYIWEYHKVSQRVSYARLSGDKKAYHSAVQAYQDSVWESLHKIRGSIGGARWFCSDTAHHALTSWYEEWFVELEQALRQLIEEDPNDAQWSEHHTRVHYEASERNYGLLQLLANDFGLRPIVEGQRDAKHSKNEVGVRLKRRSLQS